MKKVRLAVIGAGCRGNCYSAYAKHYPELLEIVAIAEPLDYYRRKFAQEYGIADNYVFNDWRDLLEYRKNADAVLIATQDDQHKEPAIAFANQGYHILLEKPMAPNEADCRAIVKAAVEADVIFAVCHVLRYTNYTQKVKQLIESGAIGDIVTIQRLEPVGYWHQAHSYVRGNWAKESICPMLLAKSCHDLDWIRYLIDSQCRQISSFGNLFHFKPENKPVGATARCLDCPHESRCSYSAVKIYLGRVKNNETGWPVSVLTPNVTIKGVTEALRTGPYGRCVYDGDNDVVDHQVVNMLFADGPTASFTMTGFNRHDHRKTAIFGTKGHIYGDGSKIELFDFLTDKTSVIDTQASASSILGGHGGGDFGLMKSFVEAVATEDKTKISSGPGPTLESHLMVFAAEKARKQGRVIEIECDLDSAKK